VVRINPISLPNDATPKQWAEIQAISLTLLEAIAARTADSASVSQEQK